ncbi:hypothetical protein FT641_20270 [Bacillus paranthracis]|uniref:hypothetical protein n=1 Tax=Bacillus paranthracis TaxID=2026186 RepID=UPI0018795CBB|nr:hypothetical protein [Bacillus paranthracis]MBE7114601.1 hypothetical protein [Bacillus paranthracis]MBE7155032.1 hypothetical protein [Bacillus paranthracis]
MQELTSETRLTLCKGLDCLIEAKEFKILQIKERTEEDYELQKEIIKITKGEFSLKETILDDVYKVQKEIDELKALRRDIDNTRNRMLFVPNYIQLHLTGTN